MSDLIASERLVLRVERTLWLPLCNRQESTHTGPSSVAVDDPDYRFACALLAARQVNREAAAMTCQQVREGQISLEQAIGALCAIAEIQHNAEPTQLVLMMSRCCESCRVNPQAVTRVA